jgi:hypothetical protein
MPESIPDFDLYAELRVPPDATAAAITAAHRSLVRRAHPDAADDDAADRTARTARLNVARDWLADPERRRRYDRARGAALARGSPERGALARRRTATPTGPAASSPSWDLARPRIDLEAFVEQCGRLTSVGFHRLGDETARRHDELEPLAERLIHVSRGAGRDAAASDGARRAMQHLRARHGQLPSAVADALIWTAVALSVADLAPADAAAVLGPWQMARAATPGRTRSEPLASLLPRAAALLLAMIVVGGLATVSAGLAVVAGVGCLLGLVVLGIYPRQAR